MTAEMVRDIPSAQSHVSNAKNANNNTRIVTAVPLATAEMDAPSLMDFSVEEVCTVLSNEAGLAKQYVEAFRVNRVDGALLNIVDEDALKELGIDSSLERKKVIAWVMKHRAPQ